MKLQDVRTWIEIDRKAIAKNYKTFRGLISRETKLLAVVKSNAYGHDLVPFAKEMERLGADFLGVDSCVEGVALRKANIETPILVLGFVLPDVLPEAAEQGISITVSNFHTLNSLRALKKKIKVHIKVDTGMSRQGFFAEEIPKVLALLKKKDMGHVELEGVYTHFGAAKNPSFPESVFAQMKKFSEAAVMIEKAGYKVIKHACATGGAILFPQFHLDMVRVGIGMYGLWPSTETKRAIEGSQIWRSALSQAPVLPHRTNEYDSVRSSLASRISSKSGNPGGKLLLAPVLSWKGVVSEVKNFPKGAKVGYDFTETLSRNTRTAIIPVGYWHGYPRALSSIGSVLIRGKRARVLGRVSMDMIVVDVTDIPNAKILDTAVLLGRDGKEEVPVDELARLCETSNYEFVTRINPKIRRVLV